MKRLLIKRKAVSQKFGRYFHQLLDFSESLLARLSNTLHSTQFDSYIIKSSFEQIREYRLIIETDTSEVITTDGFGKTIVSTSEESFELNKTVFKRTVAEVLRKQVHCELGNENLMFQPRNGDKE